MARADNYHVCALRPLPGAPGGRDLAAATALLAWAVGASVAVALLSGFFIHAGTLGGHDWDQMESHRYFVVKSLRDFGQFPFWDPYGCGGFPAWGAPEAGTIAASPLLPFYLVFPLSTAVRIEVVALVLANGLGCMFFARSYVKHPLAVAFVVVVAGFNSRFALQIAVGHTWHLYYAGMPWVLGAFDRALAARGRAERKRFVLWTAAGAGITAWMIYSGGTYPVVHTVLCLAGLAAYRSAAARDARPLYAAGALVVWGVLLAMPKLLPVAETMSRFPRITQSRETIDPASWLRMFLSPADAVPSTRSLGLDYLWHEYGQYVGALPLALVVWANVRPLPQGSGLRSLRFVGWAFMTLALGGVGPWVLLHALPVFHSQHVPSRFTYPAFTLMGVVTARALEDAAPSLRHAVESRLGAKSFYFLVSVCLCAGAVPIGLEDARCTRPWFSINVPDVAEKARGFVQFDEVPAAYRYGNGDSNDPQGTNSAPGLLVRRANVGAIRCSTAPGYNQDAPRDGSGRPLHRGARGLGDPLYRGEAWVSGDLPRHEEAGQPSAAVVRWSPSEVVVAVSGARPGDRLVLNQNWDPGWSANGIATLNEGDVNAYRLSAADDAVTFRYRPAGLFWGLLSFVLAAAALPFALWQLTPPAIPVFMRAVSHIHFIGGEKGGVGKSLVARLLSQWFIDRSAPFAAIDADASHGTLIRTYSNYAQPVDLEDFASADEIINRALAADRSVVVDLPAQSNRALERWIGGADIVRFAREAGIRLTLWHVTDGSVDSVRDLERILERWGDTLGYVAVKNLGRGKDFSHFDTSEARKRLEERGGRVIEVPELDAVTMTQIDRKSASFWAAANNTDGDFALLPLQRQRGRLWLERSYQALGGLGNAL